MMMRRSSWMIVGAALALPLAATAQEGMGGGGSDLMGWHEAQVADFETMRDKFLALADAFPEETWDWRPMEGVRSVHDVMSLMVAEGNLFPSMWGATAPEGAAAGFGPEMERVGAMSKSEVMAEMEKSFEHLIASCRDMSEADHMTERAWFGTSMTAAAVISSAAGDMHEHLGQSIAYARMNQIVPPWSR
jgi:hypothetical protein